MSARHRRQRGARLGRTAAIAAIMTTVVILAPGFAAAATGDVPAKPHHSDAGNELAEIAAGMPPGTLPGAVLLPHPAPPRAVLPVDDYHLTGRFGSESGLWRASHTGLDFAAPFGKPIRAVGAGVVTATGYDRSYGNKTVVRLSNGTELWYCHQSDIEVRQGQRVRAGQRIGQVGSTGNSTGPHLHLEVRPSKDDPVDPARWLGRLHLAV